MSAAAQWPNVHAGLMAVAAGLPNWSTVEQFDSRPVTRDNPTDWAAFGYTTNEDAGTFEQTEPDGQYAVTEVGAVRIMLACNQGDGDLPTARARAFARFNELQAAVAADKTLNGHLRRPGTDIHLGSTVVPVQNKRGAGIGLLITASYQTVTEY